MLESDIDYSLFSSSFQCEYAQTLQVQALCLPSYKTAGALSAGISPVRCCIVLQDTPPVLLYAVQV